MCSHKFLQVVLDNTCNVPKYTDRLKKVRVIKVIPCQHGPVSWLMNTLTHQSLMSKPRTSTSK